MRRPGPLTYLVGNEVSFLVLSGGLLLSGGQFLFADGSGTLALLFLIAGSYAHTANAKLREYRAWRREWDAMANLSPAHLLVPILRLAMMLAVAGWALLGMALADRSNGAGLSLYGVTTAIVLTAPLFGPARRRSRSPRRNSENVSVSLRAPVRSPSASRAVLSLPDYCRALIERVGHSS